MRGSYYKTAVKLLCLMTGVRSTALSFAPTSMTSVLGRQFGISTTTTTSTTTDLASTASPAAQASSTSASSISESDAGNESTSSSSPAAAVNVTPFVQPPRVIRDTLPVIYVYDHCPFCVRVRLALGIKNIKHQVIFMANDDIPTPTELVGKKIAPILRLPEDNNFVMMESLDIIDKFESDERYGPVNVIKPASGRTDIKEWQKSVQTLLRQLQRPRYVATGLLPEFQQLDGRLAFIKNHQLPPYDKKEWKGDGSEENPGIQMDEKLQLYAEAMAKDPVSMLEELNSKLVELDDILYSDQHCTEGGLSIDDIDLWSRLRSITIVKGVTWPNKLRSYMDNLSALGDVPLYDDMAL